MSGGDIIIKYNLISILLSLIMIIIGLFLGDLSSIFFIISLICNVISLILLFTKNHNIKFLSYILISFLILVNTTIFDGCIVLLMGSLFYNLIYYVFDLDFDFKFSFFDYLSFFILIVGMFIPISFYYTILCCFIFYSTYPIIYSMYKCVVLNELEYNNIKVNNFKKFEDLYSIKNLIFTKTGVLTLGELEINRIVCKNENLFWKYLSYAEATRNDRISKLIMSTTTFKKIDLSKRENYIDFYNGISYSLGKKNILVGNSYFMLEHDVEVNDEILAGTLIYVSVDKKIIGYLILSDKMRLSTKDIINSLRGLGIKHFSIFSNDQEKLNTVVSRTLSIHNSYGSLTKQSKDFWLYYVKQQFGKDVVLISDDHVDFDVKVKINLCSSFKDMKYSDIIILDNDLRQCIKVFEMSKLLAKWRKNLYLLIILGKILLVLFSLIFISNIWTMILFNFIWMMLEVIVGCSDFLK